MKPICAAFFAIAVAAFAAFASSAALAAGFCVSQNPSSGCRYSTIGAAVAAAPAGSTILVAPGTYREDVHITRPVSLIGSGPLRTIVNARGLANGIFIDGTSTAASPGGNTLNSVTVNGFTVENANYEGILAANASDLTLWGNRVRDNNLGLDLATSPPSCPGLPAFETDEGQDCGEGIHLMGVDHSTLASNTVSGNSGGVLLSDDTGPTEANVIQQNEISQNPFDCGITLASHPPAAITGSKVPFGVFANTVARNESTNNGYLVPGAGAGVGLFAAAPGNKTYGNVVIGNSLTRNGLPGVAIHNHVAGATIELSDNVIIGNVIAGNGGDSDVEPTPVPTGISLLGASAVAGTVITLNEIEQETVDIAISNAGGRVGVHLNNLLGRSATGIANLAAGAIDASENWWGCETGPGTTGCTKATGANLTTFPFLTAPARFAGN